MKPNRTEKKRRRGPRLARRRWVRFQGRHNPGDNRSMDECVLCDGEGCGPCDYAGLIVGGWRDIDGRPMYGMHGNPRVVQDTNGHPAEGRFRGWDGRRASLAPTR